MAESGNKLGRQQLVAALLARGMTIRRAAQRSGVAERTIRRWNATPAFRQLVADARNAYHARTAALLADAGARSVRKLVELRDQAGDEKVQLAAAKAILDGAFRSHESADLAEQVGELKRELEGLRRVAASRAARTGEGSGRGGGGTPGADGPPG